jgi:hypothetical protein
LWSKQASVWHCQISIDASMVPAASRSNDHHADVCSPNCVSCHLGCGSAPSARDLFRPIPRSGVRSRPGVGISQSMLQHYQHTQGPTTAAPPASARSPEGRARCRPSRSVTCKHKPEVSLSLYVHPGRASNRLCSVSLPCAAAVSYRALLTTSVSIGSACSLIYCPALATDNHSRRSTPAA